MRTQLPRGQGCLFPHCYKTLLPTEQAHDLALETARLSSIYETDPEGTSITKLLKGGESQLLIGYGGVDTKMSCCRSSLGASTSSSGHDGRREQRVDLTLTQIWEATDPATVSAFSLR